MSRGDKKKKPEKKEISWDEAVKMADFLFGIMQSDHFQPDYIIGISRGGYYPAILINTMMTAKWARIGYFDMEVDKDYPDKKRIRASSFHDTEDLDGKSVLLCEDDLQSGSTFIADREFLEKRGATVKTLSFFSHPESRIDPDYTYMKNIDFRPVFPWNAIQKKYFKISPKH